MHLARLSVLVAAAGLLAGGTARAATPITCMRTEPMGSFSYKCDAQPEQVHPRTEPLGSFAYASDAKVEGPTCARSEGLGSFEYACDSKTKVSPRPADGQEAAVAHR